MARQTTRTIGIFLCVVILLLQLLHNQQCNDFLTNAFYSSSPQTQILYPNTPNTPRPPQLADGCHHIFLDVGSNIGMHVRFLLEPHLYPLATIARSFFTSHFGPESHRDNRDFCIFSFEPNPSHLFRHEEMRKAYAAMGWRYHPIHAGVGDHHGNLTFYHIGDELGFTFLKSSCRKECRPEYVPVVKLSEWIENEISGRILPEEPWGDPYPPKVVMKMDIEMMEWVVFPDLLLSGVLCRDVDGVMGEFHLKSHWWWYPITYEDHGNWTLETFQQASLFKDIMVGMMERNPGCKTELSMQDDESHGKDGMPWPTPPDST